MGQTVDTDLNQHAKRDYTNLEAQELTDQFRNTAVAVPRVKEERAIDMMYEVMSRRELHLRGAEGYKKTGATVALKGGEDHLIEREAGAFWRDLGMRKKVDREIAMVEQEFEAGRLAWTMKDVRRLIKPYPAHKKEDAVLERLQDYDQVAGQEEKEEAPLEGAAAEDPAVADEAIQEEQEEDNTDESSGADDDEKARAVAGDGGKPKLELNTKADPEGTGTEIEAESSLSIVDSEHLERSRTLIATLESTKAELKKVGAVSCCVHVDNEITKERRRMRGLCRESTAVADALARRVDMEEEERRRQRRLVLEANESRAARNKVREEAAVAAAKLKKRKLELAELENLAESRQTVKRFSPEQLGQGKPRGGGVAVRKLRWEVLDRLARTGTGLSAAQKNDWHWFKEAWDEKMLDEHAADWGGTFASWIKEVLDQLEAGSRNAFSLFVHSETQRCFGSTPALLVPGLVPPTSSGPPLR